MKHPVRLFAVLSAFLLLVSATGLAASARYVNGDSYYHASHLARHIGDEGCRVTANYLKVRASAGGSRVSGHAEQADLVRLEAVDGNWAKIRVLYSADTSPDSWVGLTGWVDANYLECPCDEYAYTRNQPVSVQGGTILSGGVNLRETPSASARSLAKLSRNEQVRVYGWYPSGGYTFYRVVRRSGQNGFVRSDYLDIGGSVPSAKYSQSSSSSSSSANTASLTDCIGTERVSATTGQLRVRSTPNGSVVGHISSADRILLQQLSGGWAYIVVTQARSGYDDCWEGLSGWVSTQYLRAGRSSGSDYNSYNNYNNYNSYNNYNAVPSAGAGWNQAYASYLRTDADARDAVSGWDTRYALIFVNDDDIPELVIDTQVEASGCLILTYSSRGVAALQTSRLNFSYLQRGNALLNSDGNMGYYHDYLYTIENGRWTMQAAGEYECQEPDWDEYGRCTGEGTFIWNDQAVSRVQYYNALEQAFNLYRAVKPAGYQKNSAMLLGY